MITSKDVPNMIGKPILLKDGEWVIQSAKVVKWAGLVAKVEKGSDQKQVAVHYAWWDEKDKLYRIEHNAFARNLKWALQDLSEEYNKALKEWGSSWRTSVSETPETLTFLFDQDSEHLDYEVVLSKIPITKHGIFIQQLNMLVTEETNTLTETLKKHPVSSRNPSKEKVHEILFDAIVSEESLNNILSELYNEGR